MGKLRKISPNLWQIQIIAMRTALKLKAEDSAPKSTYTHHLPKRKVVQERKKIRQLLRSMLPMEEEQREYQEEQNFYHRRSKAH
jgi:hypothetical protein